jgi:hypothetical protein
MNESGTSVVRVTYMELRESPWLLSVALCEEWKFSPTRIWLHTDAWDHPAAISVYKRAGLRVYAVRDEAPGCCERDCRHERIRRENERAP